MPSEAFAKLDMTMGRSKRHFPTLLWLLAALLMRAGIPDGYMPAAPGSGLLFELCPSGVPDGFMMAISSSGHEHRHHEADTSNAHYDAGQCPIGHLLSAAIAVDDAWITQNAPALAPYNENLFFAPISRTPANSRSRDPPA